MVNFLKQMQEAEQSTYLYELQMKKYIKNGKSCGIEIAELKLGEPTYQILARSSAEANAFFNKNKLNVGDIMAEVERLQKMLDKVTDKMLNEDAPAWAERYQYLKNNIDFLKHCQVNIK